MILRLLPPIKLETPFGLGDAIFFEDDGEQIYWTVILPSRAIIQFRNEKILAAKQYTAGRGVTDEEMSNIIAPALDK